MVDLVKLPEHNWMLFKDNETAEVAAMHERFNFTLNKKPTLPDGDYLNERGEKMQEELDEFFDAVDDDHLEAAADALVDLVVFAKGTAVAMGLPWGELWNDVMRANLSKELGTAPNRPHHKQDLIKPEGWQPPNGKAIINRLLDEDEQI